MQANKLVQNLFSLILVFTLTLIVSVSCQKDPHDYIPPNPNPPESPADAFGNKPLRIMASHETGSNVIFPGHPIYKLGDGVVGHWSPIEIPSINELLWEIYDYKKTEQRFDRIDENLQDIKNQIEELDNSITNLGIQLKISISDLKSTIYTQEFSNEIGDINYVMGGAAFDPTKFLTYSHTGNEYAKDSTNTVTIARMETLKSALPGYVDMILSGSNGTPKMDLVVNNIHNIMNPKIGMDALRAYNNVLIQKCFGMVTDSTSAMLAYMALEAYFLININYQFQAATIWTNAKRYIDKTQEPEGDSAIEYWQITFGNETVKPQVDLFLANVDYLIANLSDYRTERKFKNDMPYTKFGIAPDDIFGHVRARARILSNIILKAVGQNYPIVSGTILVPGKYGNLENDPSVLIAANGTTHTLQPAQILSSLPYTLWKDKICSPDYNWNVYHFNDSANINGSLDFEIVGNNNVPWLHTEKMQGSVSIRYYNPQNPNQSSPTPTDECTLPFGSFSASWQWGDMYLSNPQANSGWDKINAGGFFDFTPFFKNLVGDEHLPFAGATNWIYQTKKPSTGISWYSNATGNFGMSGNSDKTEHAYVVADGNYSTVNSVLNNPSGKNIVAYAMFTGYYNVSEDYKSKMIVNIALDRHTRSFSMSPTSAIYFYHTVSNNFIHQQSSGNRSYFNGFKMSGNLETGVPYEPGIQYYFQNGPRGGSKVIHSNPVNISLSAYFQFVYEGNDMDKIF